MNDIFINNFCNKTRSVEDRLDVDFGDFAQSMRAGIFAKVNICSHSATCINKEDNIFDKGHQKS